MPIIPHGGDVIWGAELGYLISLTPSGVGSASRESVYLAYGGIMLSILASSRF